MSRSPFLLRPFRLGLALALLAGVVGLARPSAAQPNLVVVMADDLSLGAFQAVVDAGLMPHLDQHLVQAGVSFDESFVTTPLCCPSRVTFLTGQYAHNHRVFSNQSADPLKPGITWPGWFPEAGQPGRNASTVATWLESAGYRTGFVGKYLNGYGAHAPAGVGDPATFVPPGWDEWFGLVDPSTYLVYGYDLNENGTVVSYGDTPADYQTDVLSGHAVGFVQRSVAAQQPFFLLVSTLAPHVEIEDPLDLLVGTDPREGFGLQIRPAPRHAHWIDGDPANGEIPALPQPPSFDEADVSDKPSCPAPPPPDEIAVVSDPYCAGDHPPLRPGDVPLLEGQWKSMLASMLAVDDLIGAVVAELQTSGVLGNTVLLFTSDNGWFYGEHRLLGKDRPYEEAIRVPLVIRAPAAPAGTRSGRLVLNNDLAPTLAELAGATPTHTADGRSLAPLLQSSPPASWPRQMFLVESWFLPSLFRFAPPTFFALRAKRTPAFDFLYVANHNDPQQPAVATDHELYDLRIDPFQLQSLTLPKATTDAIDSYLVRLRLCEGAECRSLEGGP